MRLKKIRARDVMRRKITWVSDMMRVSELIKLLEKKRFSGVPVINKEKKIVGVVSESDIMHYHEFKRQNTDDMNAYFLQMSQAASPSSGTLDFQVFKPYHEKRVSEIMTPWVIRVPETLLITDVAKKMLRHGIHRVLVSDEHSRLKGVITSMDMTKLIADQ